MSKSLFWVGISIMGTLLPVSSGLSAQAVEPEGFSSDSFANSPILLAQSYDCSGCRTPLDRFNNFENQGDIDSDRGKRLFNGQGVRRDYEQAYNALASAVNYYNLCLSVENRDSFPPSRIQQVEKKRDEVASLREQAQILRAPR
jgi:hypothetical protein